jgi:hypothetical protein
MEYLGDKELLRQTKTAFLASSTIPPEMVLRCYDWAAGKHAFSLMNGRLKWEDG